MKVKNNIKRLLCGILALLLAFSLAGCAELIDIAVDVNDFYGDEYETEESISSDAEDNDSSEEQQESVDNATEPPADDSSESEAESSEESSEAESSAESSEESGEEESESEPQIDEDGSYTTKEDVALYIYTYGKLPKNFMTKSEARDLGWEGGSLERYAKGYCIGGDKFGNREGLLPKANGRQYYECDIDTLGASSRGAKRIVFSNDGLIYYTEDHYESFELLYGEE
ncbi:MAG: ribonuclease [Oscillospiraceae bacterium]|nr:ribonuclease [Oscillospiraceae bacterium]